MEQFHKRIYERTHIYIRGIYKAIRQWIFIAFFMVWICVYDSDEPCRQASPPNGACLVLSSGCRSSRRSLYRLYVADSIRQGFLRHFSQERSDGPSDDVPVFLPDQAQCATFSLLRLFQALSETFFSKLLVVLPPLQRPSTVKSFSGVSITRKKAGERKIASALKAV